MATTAVIAALRLADLARIIPDDADILSLTYNVDRVPVAGTEYKYEDRVMVHVHNPVAFLTLVDAFDATVDDETALTATVIYANGRHDGLLVQVCCDRAAVAAAALVGAA